MHRRLCCSYNRQMVSRLHLQITGQLIYNLVDNEERGSQTRSGFSNAKNDTINCCDDLQHTGLFLDLRNGKLIQIHKILLLKLRPY